MSDGHTLGPGGFVDSPVLGDRAERGQNLTVNRGTRRVVDTDSNRNGLFVLVREESACERGGAGETERRGDRTEAEPG